MVMKVLLLTAVALVILQGTSAKKQSLKTTTIYHVLKKDTFKKTKIPSLGQLVQTPSTGGIPIETRDKHDCDKGEKYKTGQSSSCGEHKCGELEEGTRPCTADYVSGCFCKDHLYRRQSDNKCVRKHEC
ncbi:hypothetical protein V5799_022424 [Amblyomma americanum]|uniref:Secreted protein n=1 Tax=Amblyomma americanum TaxID=6943 RepID=A0AAQ4FM31_AMBAM